MKPLELYQPLCVSFLGAFAPYASALIGAGSSAYTSGKNAKENEKDRQLQRDMQERQIQHSWETMGAQANFSREILAEQRQNEAMLREYDSARSQRKRLQEAGLNPYMIMDGSSAGSAVGEGSGSPVSPTAASGSASPTSRSYMDAMSQAVSLYNNTRLTDAEVKAKESEASKNDTQGTLFWQQSEGQRIVNDANNQYLKLSMRSGINKADSETALNDASRAFTSMQTILDQRRFEVMTPLIASQTIADASLKAAQAANINVNTKQGQITLAWLGALYGAEYLLKQSQTNANNAQASYNSALASTENLMREPRLWGLRLNNNLLKQQYDLGSENLKQAKHQTTFMNKTMNEYTENYIINMRSQLGSWKGYEGHNFESETGYFLTYLLRSLVGSATGGAATGFGFGLGSTAGSSFASPTPRKVGFSY